MIHLVTGEHQRGLRRAAVELPRAPADQFVQRRRLVDVLAVGDYREEHDIPLSMGRSMHPRATTFAVSGWRPH